MLKTHHDECPRRAVRAMAVLYAVHGTGLQGIVRHGTTWHGMSFHGKPMVMHRRGCAPSLLARTCGTHISVVVADRNHPEFPPFDAGKSRLVTAWPCISTHIIPVFGSLPTKKVCLAVECTKNTTTFVLLVALRHARNVNL
jgi:hypothetical protein